MLHYVGQKFGNYILLRLLGEGGFASVYLGEHTYLKTYAAIKILHTRLAHAALEEFLKEARTIATLHHPNIIRVLDFGVEGHIPFLVMDYAPNGSLAQLYPRGKPQPVARIITHIKQVAQGLQYAHDQHMIHRDVKPENILLGHNEEVLLSDFGIAIIERSTRAREKQDVAGTGPYMAPEQIRGMASPKSDQYALGVVVYEWLSGSPPFQGSFLELIGQHLHAAPPPLYKKVPDLPQGVEEIVMIALRKEPDRRFVNISVFADALLRATLFTRKLPPLISTPVQQQSASVARPSPSAPPHPAFPSQLPVTHQSPLTALFTSQAAVPLTQAAASPAPQTFPSLLRAPGKRRTPVSRRLLLWGLLGVGTATVAGGGITWLLRTRVNPGPIPSQGTPTPGSVPTVPVNDIIIGELLSTYKGHTDRIFAVAWSPGGQLVASGSWDKKVRVWDVQSGQTINIYEGHTDCINALAWSPDGSKIASASLDGTVQVWAASPRAASQPLTYTGHSSTITQYGVSAVAWSPDGKYIASGGDDRTVQVWHAENKTLLFTYTGHTALVRTIGWSSNNNRLASGGRDKKIHIWDALTGANPVIYSGHQTDLCALAWSPPLAGKQYIVSAGDDGQIRVWDVNTRTDLYAPRLQAREYVPSPDPLGRPVSRRAGEDDFYAPGTNVFAVAWSADGRRIAAVNVGGYVLTWDALTGVNIAAYSSSTLFVNAIAWSPDGEKLISGNDGNLVQIWRERR